MRKNKRKEPALVKIILAVVTIFQIALSIILHVLRRQETVKAIKNAETDEIDIMFTAKKTHKKVN